jgi:tetratricopeptide (TPR) repeat protein
MGTLGPLRALAWLSRAVVLARSVVRRVIAIGWFARWPARHHAADTVDRCAEPTARRVEWNAAGPFVYRSGSSSIQNRDRIDYPSPSAKEMVNMLLLRCRTFVLTVSLGLLSPFLGAEPSSPILAEIEARLDAILVTLERPGKLEAALEAYRQVEQELLSDTHVLSDPDYFVQQRMLAYVLLRQGNMLRQLNREADALELAERELQAARASQDPLTEARTQFSFGTTLLANRQIERGTQHLERARELFASHDGEEFQQGLGWYWIIRADLARVGLMSATAEEMIEFANQALTVLRPLENWAGVARAYAARAYGFEQQGKQEEAAADRASQAYFSGLADRQPGT